MSGHVRCVPEASVHPAIQMSLQPALSCDRQTRTMDIWAAAIGEVFVCSREPTNAEKVLVVKLYLHKIFLYVFFVRKFFTTKIK